MKLFIRSEFGRVWIGITGLSSLQKKAMMQIEGFFGEYDGGEKIALWWKDPTDPDQAERLLGSSLFSHLEECGRDSDFVLDPDENLVRLYTSDKPLRIPIAEVPFLRLS